MNPQRSCAHGKPSLLSGPIDTATAKAGYSVIIRTFNSAHTLPATLASLSDQTSKPSRLIVVDSGSTDHTLSVLPPKTTVHHYSGKSFNYSEAINQGLSYVDTEFVAIISSHTVLQCPAALEYAIKLLKHDDRVGAAYFSDENPPTLEHVLIDRHKFTGFNGIWNTASLLRTALVRSRPFRPEVFTCEDSEWSRWLLENKELLIARVNGAGKQDLNPRQLSMRKLTNERLAIAFFVKPEMMRWHRIIRVGLGAFKPCLGRSLFWRAVLLITFFRLTLARFIEPSPSSRYY